MEKGRRIRVTRTVSEEDLTQEDMALLFADCEYMASQATTSSTTAATTDATTTATTTTATAAATTDSTAVGVSAPTARETAAARRARRASPIPPPVLPASAREVTDAPSLLRVVTQLSAAIQKAVYEGKSVTAVNKRLIAGAAEEIRRAANALAQSASTDPQPPTTTATSTTTVDASDISDVKKELVACVRAEITKLKAELVGARPGHPSPDAAATSSTTRSYAQALGSRPARRPVPTAPTVRVSKPAIIVTAKTQAKSRQDTVTAFRKSISFKNSGFAPAQIKPVSGNKLRVEFDTSSQRDDTLHRLQGSEQVSAELARNLQPLIIVKGIDRDTPAEELGNIIRGQNPALANLNEVELRLKFKRKNRNPNLYNAIFTTKPEMFKIVTGLGRLCIDHQRVHVEEFSPFLQCFKCLQFGHVRKNCSDHEEACAFCAGSNHTEASCPARKLDGAVARCYNCAKRNSKFDTKSDTKHSATSHSCPVLCFMRARVESRIDYGSVQ